MSKSYYIGVDVGTGSVRSAVFDETGRMVVTRSKDIMTWRPQAEYYEQSSTDIWNVSDLQGDMAHMTMSNWC